MTYSKALNRIYNNLIQGEQYGYLPTYRNDYPEPELAGKPYFSPVLFKLYQKPYFGYRHYGSSAIKTTKQELNWLIHTIFDCTAPEFEKRYITKSEWEKKGR